MIRVVIADDQGLIRVGLRKVVEIEPDTKVVGEAVDGEQAVQMATRLQPDVVLMDIRMPSLDGIEATRRIVRTHPNIRVLMLTTFGLDNYVFESLRAGASGFMLKDAPPEDIAAAVRIVASGDALLAPSVTRSVIEQFARQPAPTSPRGRQCPDTPRAGGPRPACGRAVQPRDLRPTVHQRRDGQDARRPHTAKARPARPGPGGDLRLRERNRPTRIPGRGQASADMTLRRDVLI